MSFFNTSRIPFVYNYGYPIRFQVNIISNIKILFHRFFFGGNEAKFLTSWIVVKLDELLKLPDLLRGGPFYQKFDLLAFDPFSSHIVIPKYDIRSRMHIFIQKWGILRIRCVLRVEFCSE